MRDGGTLRDLQGEPRGGAGTRVDDRLARWFDGFNFYNAYPFVPAGWFNKFFNPVQSTMLKRWVACFPLFAGHAT